MTNTSRRVDQYFPPPPHTRAHTRAGTHGQRHAAQHGPNHINAGDLKNCFPIGRGRGAGLADIDPDVDAISRMSRKGGLFDKHMVPVAIPHGSLTPFNSQNTLFLYDALWAMLLPTTTTFRCVFQTPS